MNETATKKGERLPLIGAVLAGGLASACCIGPLAVALLGFGSVSAFITMEPYRPAFAAVTLVLLGWAGWRHWHGRRQCAVNGCPPKKPALLWILGGLSLLLLLSPSLIPWFFA
ncbi:MAG: mercuric transporter MerT family protein [Mariprofundaceae bacterium]|nr:mercuric transporter MerT family protein [Mariprofundaceae bacterium]